MMPERRRKMDDPNSKQLSHVLTDTGFFSALGTTETKRSSTETAGMTTELVKLGTPKTWDDNNGVYVVYDEKGRPWIMRKSERADIKMSVVREHHDLNLGAYVPHSNDGGHFIADVLPKLLAAEK